MDPRTPSRSRDNAPAGGADWEGHDGRDSEPLARVLRLGDRAAAVGLIIGIGFAVATHGVASVRAITALYDLARGVTHMRDGIHEYLWTHYEVDLVRDEAPKPAPPPEPVPEVAPKVAPPPAAESARPKDDPYDPPAAPAKASAILTAPADPDEPVDLTGHGFVTGDGTTAGYGQVSAAGTATAPTYSPHAKVGGTPGGTGTGAPAPPPVDRSKTPGLLGGSSWDCPFPSEADVEQINHAVAAIIVTVRADGSPSAVSVTRDPGHGFGRAARSCALARRYSPGLDRDGKPIASTTPPITVRFAR